MTKPVLVGVMLALAIAAPLAAQQPMAPLPPGPPHFTFDTDTEGWMSMAGDGILSHATEPANVKVGDGSLQYSYQPMAGTMAAVVSQIAGAAEARSLQGWLKCSVSTVVVVVASEQDGSSYTRMVYLPTDQWVRVALSFSDLQLGDDSVDENGRLDPDQVQNVGVLDAASFLGMLPGAEQMFPLDLTAERSLWVDDWALVTEDLPSHTGLRQADGNREMLIDDLDGPGLHWIPVGVATLIHEREGEDGYVSLNYNLVGQAVPVAGTLTGVPIGALADMAMFKLRARADTDAALLILLQEQNDARYQASVTVTGDNAWQEFAITPGEFQLADDATDANGRLDPELVKLIGILDISGMLGAAAGAQKLDVTRIAAELGAG